MSNRGAGLGVPAWRYVATKLEYREKELTQDRFRITIFVTRNVSFYLEKVMFPLLLIALLNLLSFFYPLELIGERLAHIVTLFISAFALLFVISAELPKTEYQTAIDRVVLVVTSKLALTACLSVVIFQVYDNDPDDHDTVEYAKAVNSVTGCGVAISFVAFLVFEYCKLFRQRYRDLAQARSEITKDGKNVRPNKSELKHIEKLKENLLHMIPPGLLLDERDRAPDVPPDALRLVLVKKTSKDKVVFKEKTGLRSMSRPQKDVPLTLEPSKASGGNGSATCICKLHDTPGSSGNWTYFRLGAFVGNNAGEEGEPLMVKSRYDKESDFIVTQDGSVFDVDRWKLEEGSQINIIKGDTEDATFLRGRGRDFVINKNGTISPASKLQLVLGLKKQVSRFRKEA
jgi:hypothetical protein